MSDLASIPRPLEPRPLAWKPLGGILLGYAILASILALRSDGVYHDDDLLHFLMARWAWHDPRWLLDIWGRPGCTIPYSLFAWIGSDSIGFTVCRFVTMSFAAASAVLAALCARRIGIKRPELAALFLLISPLYFRLSYTTLTEIICGLYLIGGTFLLLEGRPRLAAVVLALAPLARQESVALLAVVAVLMLINRQLIACLLLGWALAAWQILSMLFMYESPLGSYLKPKPTTIYGSGGPFHFIVNWGDADGPSMVALAIAGTFVLGLRFALERRGRSTPMRMYSWIIPICPLLLVALHTVIFMRGLFAGGGYARFLLPAFPWMAICIAASVEHFLTLLLQSRRSQLKAEPLASLALSPWSLLARTIPLVLIFGLWLINWGLAAEAMHPDGSYSWAWPHWQLMIAWKLSPLIAVGALGIAMVPNRWVVAAMLAAMSVDVVGNFCLQAHPHRLARTQELIQQGVQAAVEDSALQRSTSQPVDGKQGGEHGISATTSGAPLILGYSPWIPYFRSGIDPTLETPSVATAVAAERSRLAPPGTIFIYESSLTPPYLPLDELLESGDVLLRLNLDNSKQAPDPYVVVVRKK